MRIRQQALALGAMLSLSVAMTSYAEAQNSAFINMPSTQPVGVPVNTPIPIGDFGTATNTRISTVSITAADIAPIDNGGNIINTFFTIEGLTHSHLGDLTLRVAYFAPGVNSTIPANATRSATLFERVGIVADTNLNGTVPDDQDLDGDGFSSNFNGSYRFQDGGSSLFTVAAATDNNDVVPTLNSAGTGLPVYAASGAANGLVGLSNAFAGNGTFTLSDIVGDYVFTLSDRSNETTNTPVAPTNLLQSFTRTNVAFQTGPATAIPEPGTASAMLLGLIGFAARRRRA